MGCHVGYVCVHMVYISLQFLYPFGKDAQLLCAPTSAISSSLCTDKHNELLVSKLLPKKDSILS